MNSLKNNIRISMALGALALIAIGLSHLALTDIAHGEVDVSLEWNVLRAAALVILMFTAFSLVTLRRALKFLPV